jgi:hypothetical protein
VVRPNSGFRPRQKKSLKPTVAKTLDHATTVTLQVTVVKQHNARVQRADDEAMKLALYPSRSRCNEMLACSSVSKRAQHSIHPRLIPRTAGTEPFQNVGIDAQGNGCFRRNDL